MCCYGTVMLQHPEDNLARIRSNSALFCLILPSTSDSRVFKLVGFKRIRETGMPAERVPPAGSEQNRVIIYLRVPH